MEVSSIKRELTCLAQTVYRLQLALQAGSYNQACDALDTACAYNDGVTRELGVLRAKIVNRDLEPELRASLEKVNARSDDAA